MTTIHDSLPEPRQLGLFVAGLAIGGATALVTDGLLPPVLVLGLTFVAMQVATHYER